MAGDDSLTVEEAERLREALLRRRDEVHQGLDAARDDAKPVGLDLSIGRLTRVDAMQQQHMAASRRQRLETEHAQIQQALSKLAAGTYGECVRCGEPIGYPRLAARPETPFCVTCQQGPRE